MNDHDLERYETELRRAAPAPPPGDFMVRLRTAKPGLNPARRSLLEAVGLKFRGLDLLRWLAPVVAMATVVFLVLRSNFAPVSNLKKEPLVAASGFKADDVQVDEKLVLSFDVVAKLPSGEPVRFRCRQWRDQLVVTDKNHGVKIEQSTPRIEVVPVRFETY